MPDSISNVSLSRKLCLNNKTYNIPSKIRYECIKKKNKTRNIIP